MGLAAGALAVASTAYACVPFTGKVTWAGNFGGYTDGTLSVMGDWLYHQYCDTPPDWTAPGADSKGQVVKGSGTAQVQVSVSPPPVGDACDFSVSGNPNQLANSGTLSSEKYVLAVRTDRGEMPEGSATNNSCYQGDGKFLTPTKTSILNSDLVVSGGTFTPNATITSAFFSASQAGTYSMCISRSAIQSGSYRSAIGWNVYSL